jgi:hypothetical protein
MATRGWKRGDAPPSFSSGVFGSAGHPELQKPYGLEFGYSAPIEPGGKRGLIRYATGTD